MIVILIVLAVVLVVCEIPEWRAHNRRLDEQISDALADIDFGRWEKEL